MQEKQISQRQKTIDYSISVPIKAKFTPYHPLQNYGHTGIHPSHIWSILPALFLPDRQIAQSPKGALETGQTFFTYLGYPSLIG